MADLATKIPQNVPGRYYTDEQCIACDACIVEAPRFFEMDDENGYAFVKKQPATEIEASECENAMACCPVEAIGNDGDD